MTTFSTCERSNQVLPPRVVDNKNRERRDAANRVRTSTARAEMSTGGVCVAACARAIHAPRVSRARRSGRSPGCGSSATDETSGKRTDFRSSLRRVVRQLQPRGAIKDPNDEVAAGTSEERKPPQDPATTQTQASPNDAHEKDDVSSDWWAWTKRWALGDSDTDESDDEVHVEDGGYVTSAQNSVESVLDRVPLPPWLRDQVNNVLTREEVRESDEEISETRSAETTEPSTSQSKPSGSISVTKTDRDRDGTSEYHFPIPMDNMEAFAEALDDGHLVGDATVNASTGALAAREAVDKLEDALAAVEAQENARIGADKATQSANDAIETLQDLSKSANLSDELSAALTVARRRAKEARLASAALGEAASDVQRAREAMTKYAYGTEGADTSSETDTQRKLRLQKVLGTAGDRLLAASAASRAAAAAASKSLQQVAFFEDSGSGSIGQSVFVKTSALKTSGVNNAVRKKKLQKSFEAVELSGAVSRVAEWSVSRFAKPTAEEISDAVQPALARVVAQSLEPSSPSDLRHARVACSLAAWIYYLPTAHKSLSKFGLRMVVSSLDDLDENNQGKSTAEEAFGKKLNKTPTNSEFEFKSNVLEKQGGKKNATEQNAMARKAIDAADAAIQELTRLSEKTKSKETDGEKVVSVEAAREAARLAKRVSSLMSTDDDSKEKSNNILAVSQGKANPKSNPKEMKLPVAYAVAADDTNGTLWISIEGSTSLASWQTNLTFQPVPFEDPALDVRVHRGSYDCAKVLFKQIEGAVTEHIKRHGTDAKIHITGHSLGGSLAMVLAMMLLIRKTAPAETLADVWTFGSPYVLCGGDKLLHKLGLERSFIKSVVMGKDIVPRSFSCYYPWWVRRALEMAPGSMKVNTTERPSFLEEEMFFAPMGDMFLLQAMHGSAHPLLPPHAGLYILAGDGLFEQIARRVEGGEDKDSLSSLSEDLSSDDLSDVWLSKRTSAGWGEWGGDDHHDLDVAESDLDNHDTDELAPTDLDTLKETETRSGKKTRLNRLACLTQHDASLTASLLLGSVDTNSLDFDFNSNSFGKVDLKVLLQEKGRDAARRVVLNTPHPLTVLSDPKAYGNQGSISRHHNPFNYLGALGKTRRVWEEGSQPVRHGVADALGSVDEDEAF